VGYPITSNAVFGAGAGDEEGTEEAVGATGACFSIGLGALILTEFTIRAMAKPPEKLPGNVVEFEIIGTFSSKGIIYKIG